MILLDTLLIGGLRFVLDKIAAAVDAELDDDTILREELLAAQMRFELGELSEEDFVRLERELLAAIRAVRARRQGDATDGPVRITGIEASVVGDDDGGDGPPAR